MESMKCTGNVILVLTFYRSEFENMRRRTTPRDCVVGTLRREKRHEVRRKRRERRAVVVSHRTSPRVVDRARRRGGINETRVDDVRAARDVGVKGDNDAFVCLYVYVEHCIKAG